MKITLTIPDDCVASIEQCIAAETIRTSDPDSGAPVMKAVHASVEDYLYNLVSAELGRLLRSYPPTVIREKLAEINRLQAEVSQAKPTKAALGIEVDSK